MHERRTPLTWAFATLLLVAAAQSLGYDLYFGNLHSHSEYSNDAWNGTPAEAFAFARDVARIQVLAVTDHDHAGLQPWQFEDCRTQAAAFTEPGRFVAIAGIEWTDDYRLVGHLNVLLVDSIPPQRTHPFPESIFAWSHRREGAIGQFNHPYPGNWDRMAHSSTGDECVSLYEMLKGEDGWYEYVYRWALDNGWRVGMTANQDNHLADWGARDELTGIWAEVLSTDGVREALASMRTYGTMDRNFQFRYTVNDSVWMGSSLPNGPLHFQVYAVDPDRDDDIARIDIVTNGGSYLRTLLVGDTNSVMWEFDTLTSQGERRYFYVRVIQSDGDTVVSSPIWTPDFPGIAEAEVGGAETSREVQVKAEPNPFSRLARISYSLPVESDVSLRVYNAAGREVTTLKSCRQAAGRYTVSWDVSRVPGAVLPQGTYFCRLEAGEFTATQKMVRGR